MVTVDELPVEQKVAKLVRLIMVESSGETKKRHLPTQKKRMPVTSFAGVSR